MRRLLALFLFISNLWLFGGSFAHGENWPQFLGPQRNGMSAETGLLERFPSSGPKVIWTVEGGIGMSAVAVVDDVAYTAWNQGADQVLAALNANTGEKVWDVVVGRAYRNSMGDGPRATPAVDGGRVFMFTGEGTLCNVDAASGELLWNVDVVQLLNAEPSDYGMSSSPLVSDGQVIVHAGGESGAIVSLERKSGDLRWKVGGGPAGYSSPTLGEIDGVKQVVSVTGTEVIGVELGTGAVLWRYPFETDYACNTANPVIVGDSVFISAGENHGCVLLGIQKDSGDDWKTKVRWESTFTKSVMRNEWQTSIVIDGHLYGFDNVGAAGPITHLSCIELATGKPVWRQTRFGKGNMVYADGKFWITNMDGELVVATMTPEKYTELGRAKLFGTTRQTLSIANGRGFIRDDTRVYCIDLRRER